jgi:biotin carboxylase
LPPVVKRVRIVFPTAWDRQQLAAHADLFADVEVVFEPPDDADCAYDFDVLGYIDRAIATWRGTTDGVVSSSDYPGAMVAAAIGSGLALPACAPDAVLRAAHKGLARAVQSQQAPAATPPYSTFDPEVFDPSQPQLDARIGWPCWVKPCKGTFSTLARRVASARELAAFLQEPFVAEYRACFLQIYGKLLRRYLGPDVDGTAFVAEGELRGELVTVEGFAADRGAQAIGVVDSVRHERTGSFAAFEYPSALPAAVQQRMAEVACRVADALHLRWTMFNVEMTWDPATDAIGIVELNPRMCGQFADLWLKVDGVHGHRIALDLALGRTPRIARRGGTCAVAASFPLRAFAPARVLAVPGPADLAAAQALFPDTLCWNEVRAGDLIGDFVRGEDGHSHRYGIVNVGAGSRRELAARRDAVVARLGYRLAPSEPPPDAGAASLQPPPSAR